MEILLSLNDMIEESIEQKQSFSEYALFYHAKDMEANQKQVLDRMITCIKVMKQSVEVGLNCEKTRGGLVGGDAKKINYKRRHENYKSLTGQVLTDAIEYALAVGEANASMSKIVAAPTAGASGVLPAVFFALEKPLNLSEEDLAKGLAVAGLIGLVIASRATLSGAVGGCQAECGSAAAMAAGAAVALAGGSAKQVGNAAAIAMKNMMGLVCDPVAGLVEVPCIKRNAGAAAQALVAAEMALAEIESFIPVDEVFDAMKSVGNSLPCTLKETSCGGIAVTPTALAWLKNMQ